MNASSNISSHSGAVRHINLHIVQNQISPLILTFGASDPVGSIGITADLATFSAMGCYGLPILTSYLIGDTSQIDDIYALDADMVSDQARTVLEDMVVTACKIGLIGSVENATEIAEIISDYPELPLVLDPFTSDRSDAESDVEDRLLSIRELLIPQATLLLISPVQLSLLAETWKEGEVQDIQEENREDMLADAMTLIESGCEYVLLTGTLGQDNSIVNILLDRSGIIRSDQWQRLPGVYLGAGNTLSAAITALLANGLEIPEAVLEAQEFTFAAIQHAQRLGMGKLIPDRHFWTKESE